MVQIYCKRNSIKTDIDRNNKVKRTKFKLGKGFREKTRTTGQVPCTMRKLRVKTMDGTNSSHGL